MDVEMPVQQSSTPPNTPTTHSYETLKVIRRNGSVIPFNATKISVALTKAFLDVEGRQAATSKRIHDIVADLTNQVCDTLGKRYLPTLGTVNIEEIQNEVVAALMVNRFCDVAASYVLYREEHRKRREQNEAEQKIASSGLHVTLQNGQVVPLDTQRLQQVVEEACLDLEEVEANPIVEQTVKNLFDQVHIIDVYKALVMSARTLVESEPNYTYVSARLLLHNVRVEVMEHLHLPVPETQKEMVDYYPASLVAAIRKGIATQLLDPKLQQFDLEMLGNAIQPERDFLFSYLGLQTLYDRYFLHHEEKRFELPQVFFMRVAMGLAIAEDNPNERAIEFYNIISKFDYMCSTPTLFNSGTTRPQLSSCYLTTVPDDLKGIFAAITDNALLSKYAGGLGNDWTQVRAMNAHIKGTNGKSQGVVPFLKIANDTAVAVNQGGKRKGAKCAYLETWHLDIEEFLELRKNTGDDRRRTHDMNTANWVPDLFMKRVLENKDWTLFSPDETPDLHDLYGEAFEQRYVAYERMADEGSIRNYKRLSATNLWRKMLSMLFETGHPWITFKDACNLRSPQQHAGVIHSSNLCTEITLNTSIDEIAVCNLGSVNLAQHVTDKGLDVEKLKRTVKTAIRMLDNVIDINYYSVIQARRSNLRHRPIGLGLMGFQDCLYKLNIPYASEEAVEFADRSMEHISYYAIEASCALAEERGTYSTFEGSLWSKGILPIDSIDHLQQTRGMYLDQDRSQSLEWQALREKVRTLGMRNSNVMAIAPTATISNICGVSQSIEPTYQNLYVKSNLSGEFTVVNQYLVRDLKAQGLWDPVMVNDLKYYDGSTQNIDRISDELKQKYATAFEVEPKWLIEAGSRRQKWIDQAQSLNLYIAKPSGKKLDTIYRTAWLRGLKTTYYLRSLGATDTEKSTLNRSTLNAVQPAGPKVCPIDDPSCEACE